LRNKFFAAALACATFAALFLPDAKPAQAIPLFAQRYRLQCGACHSVLPELNAFGQAFRAHGYQLNLPRHGTTGVALRYQMEYEDNPSPGSRRFSPGGILLTNWDFGKVAAFVHYSLGAGGGPSGVFLGYLATYNEHTQSLYRLGLFELPLAQSPGQRNDSVSSYGYYGAHVGLNDLPLSSPRWGAQYERTFGNTVADFTADLGEYKGAAYGGKPIPTGETTSANSPEIGFWLRTALVQGVQIGGEFLDGSRHIVPDGRTPFADPYTREGLLLHAYRKKLDLQAEQWWGTDRNPDGFNTVTGSSGGYARLKYYPTPHWYLGVRYDAQATPFISRDIIYYTAFHVTPHVRLLFQDVRTIGVPGPDHFGGALTVGLPWPLKL
jgi:hypothetical protein